MARNRVSGSRLSRLIPRPYFILIALAVLGTGIYANTKFTVPGHFEAEDLNATYFESPRDVKPFTLTDHKGQPYTHENFKHHWTLLFFGFTHCPYICPTTMTELARTFTAIEKRFKQNPLQVVMVSLDPERDTVKRMGEYVTSFNKKFIGVTGDREQINKVSRDFNVISMRIPPTGSFKKYDIDHSATIMMINPEGKLTGIFSMPHNADEIARDVKAIHKHYTQRSDNA